MPSNGSLNDRFGVYRNVCCGIEIVIPDGVMFPDCPSHLKLSTEWKPVEDDRIRHVTDILPRRKDPAA